MPSSVGAFGSAVPAPELSTVMSLYWFTERVSGHMFFADRYPGYDDAIYATVRLLEIVTHSGKSLRELLADVPVTFTTPGKRPCTES